MTNRLPSEGMSFYWRLWLALLLSGLAAMGAGLMTSALANTTRQATDIVPL